MEKLLDWDLSVKTYVYLTEEEMEKHMEIMISKGYQIKKAGHTWWENDDDLLNDLLVHDVYKFSAEYFISKNEVNNNSNFAGANMIYDTEKYGKRIESKNYEKLVVYDQFIDEEVPIDKINHDVSKEKSYKTLIIIIIITQFLALFSALNLLRIVNKNTVSLENTINKDYFEKYIDESEDIRIKQINEQIDNALKENNEEILNKINGTITNNIQDTNDKVTSDELEDKDGKVTKENNIELDNVEKELKETVKDLSIFVNEKFKKTIEIINDKLNK